MDDSSPACQAQSSGVPGTTSSGNGGSSNNANNQNDCPTTNPNCILNPNRDDPSPATDIDGDGVPNIPDPNEPPVTFGTHSDPGCVVGELVECFYRRGRLPTGDYYLTQEELDNLMLAVYLDIAQRPISVSDFQNRAIYDTLFWDGYGADTGSICVDAKCYNRTEVNYVAQGMYSAKYEGSLLGEVVVNLWKYKEYKHFASEGTINWFEVGNNFYNDQTECFACYGGYK